MTIIYFYHYYVLKKRSGDQFTKSEIPTIAEKMSIKGTKENNQTIWIIKFNLTSD